jgi:Uncharacterized conserved protein
MIRIVATFNMKTTEIERSMPLFEELVTLTRQEEGCYSYDLAQSTDDANVLVILESWSDQAALDKHSASEHFLRIVPQLVDMSSTAPSITSFTQII